ncbi:alpha/beta hydrolase family protein [Ruania zhangjianzhongii]|uniref:alpha/beta hydrolase family protein n=1 Tax=Ruania zhangjianzhongii TaxID=2603206 RepID=UPI0011CC0D81|nr:hypothetical protein [Ruania zhangjianzhongii]
MTDSSPADLRSLSGLWELARSAGPLFSSDTPDGAAVRSRLRTTLGLLPVPDRVEPETAATWSSGGVDAAVLRWDVGFGAPSVGWLLRPAGEARPLPGVVALHCHGGVKYYGKEKIADGPRPTEPGALAARAELYGGIPYANELARRGYAVLVPDAFGWGSRRIPIEDMPGRTRRAGELAVAAREQAGEILTEAARYDAYAWPHEDAMAKLLGILGTSWGGAVAREDSIAVDLLDSRADVLPGGVGVVGLSGGGARAALATALNENVRAAAVIAMMSTMEHLLDGYVHSHAWLMMNPGIGRVADWPDIAAARRPRPLFVGYAERDGLFPLAGMRAADELIAARYTAAGARDAYRSVFVDAPHSFPPALQQQVGEFFDEVFTS